MRDVTHLEQLVVNRAIFHQNASVQFATVLIANLMIINSGALFACVSILDKIQKNATSSQPALAIASFVVGIILATICGYSAYHNFMAHAQYEFLKGYESIFDEKHPIADESSPSVVEWRRDTILAQKKWERIVVFTLWSGNLTGIGSLVAFVFGCFSLGNFVFG